MTLEQKQIQVFNEYQNAKKRLLKTVNSYEVFTKRKSEYGKYANDKELYYTNEIAICHQEIQSRKSELIELL